MKIQKFTEIAQTKYHNRKIAIRCVVAGKSLAPYRIPRVIEITDLSNPKGQKVEQYIIKPKDEKILMFLDIHSRLMSSVLREVLELKHKKFRYKICEVQYVDRIFFHQVVGEERSKEYQMRMGYTIGQSLDVNCRYQMVGYSTIDPQNQQVTYVFTEFKKLQSDIELFNILKEHDKLKEFQIEKPTASRIFGVLEELYKSYAHNITKIYYRMDLHLAVDLVFHSALQFQFGDEWVKKGWMDVMILGDTRCGKGYVAERLVDYFNVGEVISAENSSYAGIVAGLEQYNKHWTVRWGKLPMNDRGLLVIDEAASLNDSWSMLSRIRSEGIAEVTKIHTQVVDARTRLIFIANPIQKTIANYSYGIQAIQEIVKAPEDIARFDYVLVVAHDEVSMKKINKPKQPVKTIYDRDLERKLILWTWSRGKHDVIFTDEAIDKTYYYAILLAKEYDFSIPLIQGENIRIKLARIAIAFASRFYSASKDGEKLVVSFVHVECAYVFLSIIYKKSSCGYHTFSKLKLTTEAMQEDLVRIDGYFNSWKDKKSILRCLLQANNIVVKDICEYLDRPIETGNEVVSWLLRHNCIVKKHNCYVKTPPFTAWLKRQMFDIEKEDAGDE